MTRETGSIPRALLLGLLALSPCAAAPPDGSNERLERVAVATDGRGFILKPSRRRFVPWGFNYDHDAARTLLEDYWHTQWSTVEEDFQEMKALGANVVRIHLQLGKFMRDPQHPNERELRRLSDLLALAERTGLYLDVTGLGCYVKADVPEWYDPLPEARRWAVQARFWSAIAERCATSPAVFCYDLMNEPVVPGGDKKRTDWLGPPFAGKFHFVQFIALERAGRPRSEIARRWIRKLSAAIRMHDPAGLITVGLVPWSLDRPGLTSGFPPQRIASELDFISMHIYPEKGKNAEALRTLRGFNVGKPVVIEEIFPLKCSAEQLEAFLSMSTDSAAGWIGFYWGKTPDEYRRCASIRNAIMLRWLELFQKGPPTNRP